IKIQSSSEIAPVIADGLPKFFSGCRSSGSLRIPTAHSNKGIALPIEHISIRGASTSISPGYNDGNLCNLENLEQHHKVASVRPCSRQSEAAPSLLREHVFSSAKSLVVGLTEEKIGKGKRSEKGGETSDSPALQPVTLINKPQQDITDESNSGPTYSHASADLNPNRPKDRAGKPTKKSFSHKGRACGLGPKLSRAYRSKGKGKSLKKGPNSKRTSASITRGPSVDLQTSADAGELPVDSIHDSNIENMNQIFLTKFNLVTADKIWNVGKCLEV
ncbi:hypothetical protein Ancab_031170, partial [Ancistrocladus abbreviatus]